MSENRSFFRKLWDFMNSPRLEKPLMIAAPCLTLVLLGLIFLPRFLDGSRTAPETVGEPVVEAVELAAVSPDVTSEPTAEPTDEPTPEPSEEPLISLRLVANSVNRDLYVRILDADGTPVTGHTFTLDVQFPGGATYSYDTEEDGSSYYLVRLEPGEYVVSMQSSEGYADPEPIHCTVHANAQYTPIENIDEMTEVKDVSEVNESEIPGDTNNAPDVTIPEEIEEAEPEPEPEPDPEPGEVVDEGGEEEDEEPASGEEGEQKVTYQFVVGPNGFLLYRGTDEESNVIPVDEDGDGIPEYGMYLVEPETEEPEDPGEQEDPDDPENPEDPGEQEDPEVPETPAPQPYYVTVELYNEDGTPVDTFEYIVITPEEAEEVVEEKKVGWRTIDGNEYFFYEDGSVAVGLKRISGKLYYFNQYGVKASSVGIDVSFYNEDIDWYTVKSMGIDFAIIRVGGRAWSSGDLYGDSRTQEYLRGARAAGVKIGVYFYSTAINPYEAVEEASVALQTIGGIPLDYPIFIDMEYSGIYPRGRADQLTASERTEIAIAFCETIRNSGYRAGVYASQNYLKTAISYSAISGYTIWLASYTRDDQLPNFAWRYDIWQFTDRGLIDGIEGDVDMNVIF